MPRSIIVFEHCDDGRHSWCRISQVTGEALRVSEVSWTLARRYAAYRGWEWPGMFVGSPGFAE